MVNPRQLWRGFFCFWGARSYAPLAHTSDALWRLAIGCANTRGGNYLNRKAPTV